MDGPLCKSLYVVLILFQSFGWSKTFLIRKILIGTIIPFIQHFFVDWLSFLLLDTIKNMSNKHLMQLFIFNFSSKHGSVFLQSHSQDTLCTSFQAKWKIQGFQFKFLQKMDLGLKFQKTNLKIRINIFEILCVYVRVCQFSGKTNSFEFSSANLPKNGFRVSNSENYRQNKNQHPRYTTCANF